MSHLKALKIIIKQLTAVFFSRTPKNLVIFDIFPLFKILDDIVDHSFCCTHFVVFPKTKGTIFWKLQAVQQEESKHKPSWVKFLFSKRKN